MQDTKQILGFIALYLKGFLFLIVAKIYYYDSEIFFTDYCK